MKLLGDFKLENLSSCLDKMEEKYISPPIGVLLECEKIDLIRKDTFIEHSIIFQKEIEYAINYLKNYYGDGYCPLMILLTIPPNKEIPLHRDKGKDNEKSKRNHFVISTNKDCIININDIEHHLELSKVYSLNTFEHLHGSKNNGITKRTHLIADWVNV